MLQDKLSAGQVLQMDLSGLQNFAGNLEDECITLKISTFILYRKVQEPIKLHTDRGVWKSRITESYEAENQQVGTSCPTLKTLGEKLSLPLMG